MEEENVQNDSFQCYYNWTEHQSEVLQSTEYMLEGPGSLIIGIGGILINFLAIFVILKSDLKSSFFYWLLICLEVFDSSFLGCCVLESFRKHIGTVSIHNLVFANFLFPFKSVVMLCSIYTAIALSVERYNALVNPVSHRSLRAANAVDANLNNHLKRLLKYMGPILLICVTFYIPRFFEVKAFQVNCKEQVNTTNCSSDYRLNITELRRSDKYVLWYINILNLIVTCAIPLISILYLNCRVYFGLRQYLKRKPSFLSTATMKSPRHLDTPTKQIKETQRADKVQQTMTLFGIIIVFCICHSLRVFMNIEELVNVENIRQSIKNNCTPWSFSLMIIVPISETLLQINCSINFFVYCAINKRFKEVALGYVRSIFGLKKKSNLSQAMSRKETITNRSRTNTDQQKIKIETQETQDVGVPLLKIDYC